MSEEANKALMRRMVVEILNSGTHRGDLMGLPPSGKRVTFEGVGVTRTSDGKFVES